MESMRRQRRQKKIRPLGSVTPDWKSDASTYPERLRVPMSNGTVRRYVIEEPQPHPSFLFAMQILDSWESWPEGSYKPPKIKKRRGL